ncbi:MAG: hypothetical protein WCF84_15490, partial [Anaerolineae bacterium]
MSSIHGMDMAPGPFSLDRWKQDLAGNLRAWKAQMAAAGVNSAYAFIAAAALWPVAQAARQGDWSALMALGGVTADLGTNLLANQIQKWKDAVDAAAQLASQVDTAPALRQELDAVLEKLAVFDAARNALAESDRAWFKETLKAELARLGNLRRFEAVIAGDSNITVQGDANTVQVNSHIVQADGNRSVAAENISDSTVITGDQTTVNQSVTGDHNIFSSMGNVNVTDQSGGTRFHDNQVEGETVIVTGDGATIIVGERPIKLSAVERDSALGRYLTHVISRTRYLQLQGIRSGGKLVNIELESIFVTLRATRTRTVEAEQAWLEQEGRVPGERGRMAQTETTSVTVQEAMADHKRLVILGDPGSGKTTLLRYLALHYARDRAEGTALVRSRLGLPENGYLPILLPLRNLGAYLHEHHPADDGTEGHARLLDFLYAYLKGERLDLPGNFFDADFNAGRVVLFLDGMDEVGDEALRRRVARLVESFAAAYPHCRIVVTSRVVGYAGAARLGEEFATTTVQDFTLADVKEFLTHWHRLVAIGQMGPGESAEHFAAEQTGQLLHAIASNPRVRDLAVNPLMLTVIALVHRDRVKLPDRRAELYEEAVDVLLGKWDEARGVDQLSVLDDRPFDTSDRRLLLQSLALEMQAAGKKE